MCLARSLSRRAPLKISFECSILYRLLLLMGARFLRSSRCRKATGLSIQLTHRNPSGCPLPSLRNMSGERKYHASAFNPARVLPYKDPRDFARIAEGLAMIENIHAWPAVSQRGRPDRVRGTSVL